MLVAVDVEVMRDDSVEVTSSPHVLSDCLVCSSLFFVVLDSLSLHLLIPIIICTSRIVPHQQ